MNECIPGIDHGERLESPYSKSSAVVWIRRE